MEPIVLIRGEYGYEGDWWWATSDDDGGIATQARRLSNLPDMIQDALECRADGRINCEIVMGSVNRFYVFIKGPVPCSS